MLRGMQMSYSVSARSFASCLTGLLLLPVLGFSVSGCAYGSVQNVLRAQIASEMDCPEMRVRTRPIYEVGSVPGHYTASGCGIKRIYECPKDAGMVSYDEQVCSLLDDPLAKKVAAPAEPSDPMTDDMGDDTSGEMGDDSSDTMGEEPSQESGDVPAAEDEPEPEAAPASKGKFKASGKFKVGD